MFTIKLWDSAVHSFNCVQKLFLYERCIGVKENRKLSFIYACHQSSIRICWSANILIGIILIDRDIYIYKCLFHVNFFCILLFFVFIECCSQRSMIINLFIIDYESSAGYDQSPCEIWRLCDNYLSR
jgi:hypothetical protein